MPMISIFELRMLFPWPADKDRRKERSREEDLPIYGLMAEFDTPDEILDPPGSAHEAGYTAMDAYSPFPVEGLSERSAFARRASPSSCFSGGSSGAPGDFSCSTTRP